MKHKLLRFLYYAYIVVASIVCVIALALPIVLSVMLVIHKSVWYIGLVIMFVVIEACMIFAPTRR